MCDIIRQRMKHLYFSYFFLAFSIGILSLGVALLAWFPSVGGDPGAGLLDRWRLLMTILAVLIGWRCLGAVIDPIPARVQMAVKHAILSVVILDASVGYVARGTGEAVMILVLLAPAMWLSRWIPSP